MSEGQTRPRRLGGLRDMKTATSARVRSKPSAEGQEYLDLWTLKRERARWSRTKQQAEQRLETIDAALAKIHLPEQASPAVEPDTPDARRTIDLKTSARRRCST